MYQKKLSGKTEYTAKSKLFSSVDDEATQAHGPHEGGGHLLFLSGTSGPDGDYTDQIGRLESPTYRDSASECHISFSHYINGDLVSRIRCPALISELAFVCF